MKLEFLADGAEACPLIRMFDAAEQELETLYDKIGKLADNGGAFWLHGLRGFDQSSVRLQLVASAKDAGLHRAPASTDWTWELTKESWDTVAALIEPFVSDHRDGAFQWLTGPMARHGLDIGETSVLLSASRDGRW